MRFVDSDHKYHLTHDYTISYHEPCIKGSIGRDLLQAIDPGEPSKLQLEE